MAKDATERLAEIGYRGAQVYRVDAEGAEPEIVFLHAGRPKTAYIEREGRLRVVDGWPV